MLRLMGSFLRLGGLLVNIEVRLVLAAEQFMFRILQVPLCNQAKGIRHRDACPTLLWSRHESFRGCIHRYSHM